LRKYLKWRAWVDENSPLFAIDEGDFLHYAGLSEIVRRLAVRVGIPCPGFHHFRRAYAIAMWRGGVDIITLSQLRGHSTTEVLKRYLNQSEVDFKKVAQAGSSVDFYKI